jgi:hypothetical protein
VPGARGTKRTKVRDDTLRIAIFYRIDFSLEPDT